MPNIFQRIGGLFHRQEQPVQEPVQQEPEREERRGFFSRVRDRVTGADRRREEAERQRQEHEQVAAERAELQREREAIVRERAELQRERAEREQVARERAERTERREAREPGVPAAMAGISAIMPLGPKGRDGAAYTTISGDVIMGRLREAAVLDKRVSLRVLDKNGWHDLFVNSSSGPGRHKPARGMTASYMERQISHYGGDLDEWVADGCDCDGDAGYEDAWEDISGYQLTVWS